VEPWDLCADAVFEWFGGNDMTDDAEIEEARIGLFFDNLFDSQIMMHSTFFREYERELGVERYRGGNDFS
jgi:hypothetical protein